MHALRRSSLALGLCAGLALTGCYDAEESSVVAPESSPLSAKSDVAEAVSGLHYRAHLTGDEEVPPVDNRAQGQATFRLSRDGTELSYRLIVANIEDVFMAHIHMAPPGVNGGVVVWLYPEGGPPPQLIEGRTQGVLATGVITADDLTGALAGMELSDLVAAMDAGNTYVNVHTTANPGGEIRGQIE